ncbi:NlpC/P60 family protein [Streptomyces qaidamensis]|uniref:C40 family peptidase n=1 Tax=Streptomyces qaidamensis TaxID=1783515 RepID=UPI0036F17009
MPALTHDGEGPSPDEVRRRIDSLYDRAESDTGTFNATRAAAIPRQRGAAARGRSEGETPPAVGALARQWFDVARAKLGPSVPAWQSDRKVPARPERAPEAARPVRPAERPAELRAIEAPPAERPAELRALEAPPAELPPEFRALEAPPAPTGGAWELPSGSAQAPAAGALPELSSQLAATAAAGEARLVGSASPAGARPGLDIDVAAWPLYESAPAPALESGPQSLAALPAVPAPTVGDDQVDLLTSGTEAYGSGPATGATAPYVTPLSADLTAYHASGSPADRATTTRGAGLPGTYGEPWMTPVAGRNTQADRVIAFARAQIGLPCVWGAVGPGSYDAAGLTQAAWKAVGVMLPRTTQAQWSAGIQVPLADVQVGDLVFFHDDLGHVGIWSGDGMMIHASGPGALIREESVFFAGQSAIKGAVRPA